MRVHRVASSNGYSAYLEVFVAPAAIRARVRVVRDADGASILAPSFRDTPRHSVVQWACEFGRAIVTECAPPGSGSAGGGA